MASSPPFLQAAERVLQQEHWLQGSELILVPHYDVLEPEGLDDDTSARGHSAELGPGATEHALLEAGGPARALRGAGTVTLDSEEAPGRSRASLRTGPIRSLEQARPVSLGPVGSLGQAGLESPGPVGSPGQAGLVNSRPIGSPGPVGSMEIATGAPGQEGLVEMVLSMEPGAMRFIQRHHEDLLAGLDDVALFPLEGSDVAGFRVCGL